MKLSEVIANIAKIAVQSGDIELSEGAFIEVYEDCIRVYTDEKIYKLR